MPEENQIIEEDLSIEVLKSIDKKLSELHEYLITQNELEELEKLKIKEQETLDLEQEQIFLNQEEARLEELLLIRSAEEEVLLEEEVEFRESLISNINDLTIAINNLPENDFEVSNENFSVLPIIGDNTSTLVQPVELTEKEIVSSDMNLVSSIGISFLVFVIVPIFLVTKFFSYVFNRFLNNIF